MGSAYLHFTDKAGKSWDPITLSPPKTINCTSCSVKVTSSSAKLMSPIIHVYRCANCAYVTEIQDTDTIEHWPAATVAEYQASMKAWEAAGRKYYEVIGEVIYNPLGVTKMPFKP